jgi:hypothetical protein
MTTKPAPTTEALSGPTPYNGYTEAELREDITRVSPWIADGQWFYDVVENAFRKVENPDFDTSRYHGSPVTALRTEEFKYLKSGENAELVRPLDEETDVSGSHPDVVERLDGRVDQLLEEIEPPTRTTSERAEFTEEMEQQLSDLGYL